MKITPPNLSSLTDLVDSFQLFVNDHQPKENKTLRIVSWNIEKGKNLKGILNVFQSVEGLKNPDIVVLTEVDIGMFRSGNCNVGLEMANSLGLSGVYHTNYLELSLGDAEEQANIRTGHWAEPPRNRESLHGNAILFRGELLSHHAIALPDCIDPMAGVQKRFGKNKASLVTLNLPGFGAMTIVGVHLDIDTTIECRTLQALFLSQYLLAHKVPEPIIIAGDFNSTTLDRSRRYKLLKQGGWLMLHGIDFYRKQFLEPWTHESLFERLEQQGFAYRPYNVLSCPTAFYPFYRLKILEQAIPRWGLPLVGRKFRKLPWPGIPLELDWFFVKGLGKDYQIKPSIVEVESISPQRISDHLPIVLDISW